MNDKKDPRQKQQRRSVVGTALILAAVVLVIYLGYLFYYALGG